LAGAEAERITGAKPDELACQTDLRLAEIYAGSICSPAAVPAFLEYSRQEARAILKTYLFTVQAVAASLETAGSLTCEEIDFAISDAIERSAAKAEKARRANMARMIESAAWFHASGEPL
jgi:hypothetical protein